MILISDKAQQCTKLAKDCNEGRCFCDEHFVSCPFEDDEVDCDEVTWEHWRDVVDFYK